MNFTHNSTGAPLVCDQAARAAGIATAGVCGIAAYAAAETSLHETHPGAARATSDRYTVTVHPDSGRTYWERNGRVHAV